MARQAIDLTGQRFGNLTVIQRYAYDTSGKITWRCDCDCGNWTITTGNNLKSGNTTRCGHGCSLR